MHHTLVFHTINISRKLQKAVSYKSNSLSLSYTEISALIICESQIQVSQMELAQMLQIEPPSVVTMIDKLENQKLVKRKPIIGNRRKYQIVLTALGKTKIENLESHASKIESQIRSSLGAKKTKEFLEIINIIGSLNLTRREVKNELPSA